jgi:FixJ family two-component response regulator
MATLTPHEREVLDCVVRGLLNKQIGGDLGVHEKTIKVHRSRVFNKMGARSLAELVRMTAGMSE